MRHTYEGAWDKSSPVLDTCNPGRMIYVTHNLPPQPVAEGIEVIFTYDVRFMVRGWMIWCWVGMSGGVVREDPPSPRQKALSSSSRTMSALWEGEQCWLLLGCYAQSGGTVVSSLPDDS